MLKRCWAAYLYFVARYFCSSLGEHWTLNELKSIIIPATSCCVPTCSSPLILEQSSTIKFCFHTTTFTESWQNSKTKTTNIRGFGSHTHICVCLIIIRGDWRWGLIWGSTKFAQVALIAFVQFVTCCSWIQLEESIISTTLDNCACICISLNKSVMYLY